MSSPSPARAKLDALLAKTGSTRARVVWLSLPSPVVAGLVGRATPTAAVIDREHGAIGIETAALMIQALQAAGTPALVRVPGAAPAAIAQALDAGAAGVAVAQVESVEEAQAAVRAHYFPPLGARGYAGPVIAATGFGADDDYVRRWNDTGLLIVQIESGEGLETATEIARLDGVDMLFFGPFDYALDQGLDPATDADALAAAFQRIQASARAAGKLSGTFPWPGLDPAAQQEIGADLMAVATDITALKKGLDVALSGANRRAMADRPAGD
ncbi:MAG: aldolase/citrate lyase family protein [Pseudomonadota bacterium]